MVVLWWKLPHPPLQLMSVFISAYTWFKQRYWGNVFSLIVSHKSKENLYVTLMMACRYWSLDIKFIAKMKQKTSTCSYSSEHQVWRLFHVNESFFCYLFSFKPQRHNWIETNEVQLGLVCDTMRQIHPSNMYIIWTRQEALAAISESAFSTHIMWLRVSQSYRCIKGNLVKVHFWL